MRAVRLIPLYVANLVFSSVVLAIATNAHEHAPLYDQPELIRSVGWDIESAEITAQKVSDGLYVLFGLGGNIALSMGTDGVLLVDDQLPQLAEKVLDAISDLGGDGVDYIVNTHWHWDHAEGNLNFGPKGSTIISHHLARRDMSQGGPINMVVSRYLQQPYPTEALPELTYQQEMVVHFNSGEVVLRHFSPAHTTGDTAVFFEPQNAVHLGDTFFSASYPFIDVDNGGSIDGLINFCRQTLQHIDDQTIVIPGHGPVVGYSALETYVSMLRMVRNRVKMMIDQGMSLTEVKEARPTFEFDETYGPETASMGFIDRVYTSLKKDL